MKILITGATGFIGKALSQALRNSGFDLRAAVRQRDIKLPIDYEVVQIGDIGPRTDWQEALVGVDTIIHLAARVHIMHKVATDPLESFRKINVLGTGHLARMAAKAGVKRFIFISSVKVNGEGALKSYTEKDAPDPQDAYGISKREAEDLLIDIASKTRLEVVILRLPLVYGPGVKANFKNLMKLVNSSLPLPFKNINNRRSFIYIDNLVGAITTCINHPLAAGETFLLSDGQDVSTPNLIKMFACVMNKKTLLFSLHPGILKTVCKIIGKSEELDKLTGSLFVDSNKIRNSLGWKPLFSIEEGIEKTVKHYLLMK